MDTTIDKTKMALVQQQNMTVFPSMGLLNFWVHHVPKWSPSIFIFARFQSLIVLELSKASRVSFCQRKWQNEENNYFLI